MNMPGTASLLQFFAAAGSDHLNQTGQDRAGWTEQTFVGTRREECGLEVDFDHHGPVGLCPAGQRGGRLYHGAGSHHQHGLAAIRGLLCCRQHVGREHLAEPHHRGAAQRSAGVTGGVVTQFLAEFVDFLTARGASNCPYITVEFDDSAAAGLAVQPVDVLRDQCPVFEEVFQLGQCPMGRVRAAFLQRRAAMVVKLPNGLRVTLECLWGGEIFGPSARPWS